MSAMIAFAGTATANPLDIVERIVVANDWTFDRRNDEEMAVQVPGQWCDFSLYFAWNEEIGAMHFTCALDMRIPAKKRTLIYELLALINERMWLGHFAVWDDEGLPMFRHAMPLRGTAGAMPEQMEDMMDTAIAECERFYPAFQFVVWGGKTARESIAAAMIDTLGEA